MTVARHLLRPTLELGRAALKRSSIRSCTGWGLHSFSGHPKNWCALTAPFHPYPEDISPFQGRRSKAVYFLLHFPSRHRDSTLWSTLPCGVRTFLRIKYPAIVCTAPTVYFVVILLYLSSPVPSRVSCHKMDKIPDYRSVAGHYTSVAEYSCYIRNR